MPPPAGTASTRNDVPSSSAVTADTEVPAESLADLAGVHGLEIDGKHVRFEVDTEHLDLAVRRLGELGVRSLVSHPPTLEELFLRHYGDALAKEPERVDGNRNARP